VQRTLRQALRDLGERTRQTEIAFFGGSFTAIDRDYMCALLSAAQPFLPHFYGIRISTRPDAIDEEVLALLKDSGVTAIELGAQSMDDSVLESNKRGHTAEDVRNASALIRRFGFSLGLQMMTGLYGATPQTDRETAQKIIALQPDTVRIYPTVILRGTELAARYADGSFCPYTLEASVALCADLILLFAKADIPVIRLGLHYSDSLVQNSLGNNYHPAFKELCENKIFDDLFLKQAQAQGQKRLRLFVHPKSLSKLLGQRRCNINRWQEMGYEITVRTDERLDKYEIGVWYATEIS